MRDNKKLCAIEPCLGLKGSLLRGGGGGGSNSGPQDLQARANQMSYRGGGGGGGGGGVKLRTPRSAGQG